MVEPQSPQQQNAGIAVTLINAVKSISLSQALTIALLVVIAIPTYILWRAMNDETMLNKFLSRYEEFTTDKMPCTLRIVSVRGGGDSYSISTGFAFQGSDRYTVGIIRDRKFDEVELQSYCEVLQRIVDHMRRPESPSPTFPGTDEELIWHYPPEGLP